MKILHVIHTLNPKMGGPVECVNQLAGFFTGDGHTVDVLACADTRDDAWIDGFPANVHCAGPAYGKYAYSPRVRHWLNENITKFDVVIINGLWQAHVRIAASVARQKNMPYFIYVHGLMDPWNRTAHPFKYLKKFAYWLLVERISLTNARALVFTSEEEARLAVRYFPTAGWNSLVVGNGIAEPPEPTLEEVEQFFDHFPSLRGQRFWLFLSRIHPKKGLETLFQVMADLPPEQRPTLLLVGGGEERYVSTLKARARELSIDGNVIWAGPLYGMEKWAAFGAAELFVLPSHQENFGIAIVEALATGLPVCTTRAVNIWKTLSGARAGIISDDNLASQKNAFGEWLRMQPRERQAMRDAARSCFVEHFSIEGAGRRLLAAISATTRPAREGSG
ncbi:MAG TPA: glycosyltransferase [Usitatibacter sp.]|nr:glycosyltransferase [Usitatibacter sp.]